MLVSARRTYYLRGPPCGPAPHWCAQSPHGPGWGSGTCGILRRHSDGWPASAREVAGTPLVGAVPGPGAGLLSTAVGLRAGALPRRTSRKSKGGDKSGKQDVEAAFEFCGAVVARQHGGETAQEGELANGQPVEA